MASSDLETMRDAAQTAALLAVEPASERDTVLVAHRKPVHDKLAKTLRHHVPGIEAVGDVLGSGSFATVLTIMHAKFGDCAAKLTEMEGGVPLHAVMKEVAALQELHRAGVPGILPTLAVAVSRHHGVLLMRRVRGCTADHIITRIRERPLLRATPFYLGLVKDIARQLLTTLAAARDLQVMHRDVKPANIMTAWDEKAQRVRVHLIDWGFAVKAAREESKATLVTLVYRCPELLFHTGAHDAAVDAWSAGVVLWELLMGHHMFAVRDEQDMVSGVLRLYNIAKWPPPPSYDWGAEVARRRPFRYLGNVEAAEVVAGLMHPLSAPRMTPRQALAHPFLRE